MTLNIGLKLKEEKTDSFLCNPKSIQVSFNHNINVGIEEILCFNTTDTRLCSHRQES